MSIITWGQIFRFLKQTGAPGPETGLRSHVTYVHTKVNVNGLSSNLTGLPNKSCELRRD